MLEAGFDVSIGQLDKAWFVEMRHIARKIASTMSSTGTPAYFVHPAEASHGDLGMIETRGLVPAIEAADAMTKARQYGDLFAKLPKEAATRTLRFWRMRRQTGDVAA